MGKRNQRDQHHRRHHQPDCRADEPAVAECVESRRRAPATRAAAFAVVAEEIRNLADRSAKATSDIAAIIKALQEVAHDAVSATNDGLRVADESNSLAENGASGLRKILGGLSDVTGVVAQIARATEEQRGAAKAVGHVRERDGRAGQGGGGRDRGAGGRGIVHGAGHGSDPEGDQGGVAGSERAGARGSRHHQGRTVRRRASPDKSARRR
jgi:hypothetical protein